MKIIIKDNNILKRVALHFLAVIIISCNNTEDFRPRKLGIYSVFGFNNRIELSTNPKIDSIMARINPKVDSINDL